MRDGSFLNTTLHYGSSTWNSIFKAKEVLKEGYQLRLGNGESFFWYSPWTTLGPLCYQVFAVNIQDTDKRIRDIYINNQWHFNDLATPIPKVIRNHLSNSTLFLHAEVQDGYIWGGNTDGIYSAKDGYKWLLTRKGEGYQRPNLRIVYGRPKLSRRCFFFFGWLGTILCPLCKSYIEEVLLS